MGPTQNFFELGGNSLLALRLLALVHRRLACDLPVAALFAGATVRHMAVAIEERRAAPDPLSPIVPMQPHGSLPPLFCVPPADRGALAFVGLVRHLHPGQPAYGLPGAGGDPARPLAEIAAEHVAAIRSVQPEGPYHLLGWSSGGDVAYETAVRLEEAGQPVAFLGMLDTMGTGLAREWPWTGDLDLILGAADDQAALVRRPLALDREALEGLDAGEQVRRVAAALAEQGAAPDDFGEAQLRERFHALRGRVRSRAGHVARPFSGTLTLFRAGLVTERRAEFFAARDDAERPTMGWCRHAAEVEVRPVPGAHATLASEPHVRVLARQLAEALAAARSRNAAA
jgi:thioesterase domain-containing protein